MHMYDIKRYLNIKIKQNFIGPFILKYEYLKNIKSLSIDIRNKYCHHRDKNNFLFQIKKFNKPLYKIIMHSGLHLSTLGGPDAEGFKCKSFSHSEFNIENKKIGYNKNCCNNNLHNSYKYRKNNNIHFNEKKYYKINYDEDFFIDDYMFEEIKNNKKKYAHFFIFEKPYLN